MTRDDIIEKTLNIEGKYSDNPSDSGGKTMYGVTEYVARKHGYQGDMRHLSRDQAIQIAIAGYWIPLSGDTLLGYSPDLAFELFDTAYNMGTARASEFLQLALNSFNKRGEFYADLVVDGDIGPATLRALHAFISKRGRSGVAVLLRALNSLQGAYYLELAHRRPKDEDFTFGWFLHRVT